MKRLVLALMLALAVVFSAASSASAAPAYNTAFTVAITYQNVGQQDADITVDFFQEGSGTAINFPAGTLKANASTSLAVGAAITSGAFRGSAVLSSNQPVIATIVQLDPTGTIRNRPLSNGFSAADGAPKQLVATVLKNAFSSTTYFSVQNVGAAAINVKVDFYAVGAATPTHTETANNLPASSAKYFDAGKIAQLPDGFSGSAVVTAKLASDNVTDANVVVTVDEMSTTGPGSSSFEGTALSSDKIFMPSAMCNAFGGQNTAYAIQNADLANTVTFQVRYKITVPSASEVVDGPFTLTAGGKQSVGGCAKMPAGTSGSAVIERTGGTGTLVAVGKVAGLNITSAFLGIPSGGGSANVALPYIRWSPDNTINNNGQQRAGIAIQNIGTTPATNVRVEYRDRDGVLKGTHNIGTIAPDGKISSDPKLGNALDPCGRFGMYGANGSPTDCNTVLFGGGAKVVADSGAQLAVVVRIFTGNPILAGEDYTGINVQ